MFGVTSPLTLSPAHSPKSMDQSAWVCSNNRYFSPAYITLVISWNMIILNDLSKRDTTPTRHDYIDYHNCRRHFKISPWPLNGSLCRWHSWQFYGKIHNGQRQSVWLRNVCTIRHFWGLLSVKLLNKQLGFRGTGITDHFNRTYLGYNKDA